MIYFKRSISLTASPSQSLPAWHWHCFSVDPPLNSIISQHDPNHPNPTSAQRSGIQDIPANRTSCHSSTFDWSSVAVHRSDSSRSRSVSRHSHNDSCCTADQDLGGSRSWSCTLHHWVLSSGWRLRQRQQKRWRAPLREWRGGWEATVECWDLVSRRVWAVLSRPYYILEREHCWCRYFLPGDLWRCCWDSKNKWSKA